MTEPAQSKIKGFDARLVAQAYHERKVARMVANGTSEFYARDILARARETRAGKREQRRLRGLEIREQG